MRLLILVSFLFLASCGGILGQREVFVETKPYVPETLTEPVHKPNRELVTYRDAVIRDRERGDAIDEANDKLASIKKIID
jgi:hypothetical protein